MIKLKKFIVFILIINIVCCVIVPVLGADTNIDSGGGDMGNGTSEYKWIPGDDGVRITIIKSTSQRPVTTPVDFTNKPPKFVFMHFGKFSKIHYRNGQRLSMGKRYECKKADNPMPTIVKDRGGNNIDEIKNYFCREETLKQICKETGFEYNNLIDGGYKILLEPLVYITYGGMIHAMTATEAALYDEHLNGGLRSKMVDLSHKNLPLSMFLEYPELGFEEYTGSTNTRKSNGEIINNLGLGIIRFNGIELEPVDSDVTYRCDTEVITSVMLKANKNRTPEKPAYAEFKINGKYYTHENIYIPEGRRQLAWVKWRTPSEPCTIEIEIDSNCDKSTKKIKAQIVKLDENIPPDPKATDRNDNFKIPNLPDEKQEVRKLEWGEWDCWWVEYWIWVEAFPKGYWKDIGWYEYEWIPYEAEVSAVLEIKPDSKSPTAYGKTLKSGYGFNAEIITNINKDCPKSHITDMQTAIAYFPEFDYKNYCRLLEITSSDKLEFKKNEYSTYKRRCHFTPVWYPNGEYKIYAEALDLWTPAGMLQVSLNDYLNINGSVFDDWHIRPIK